MTGVTTVQDQAWIEFENECQPYALADGKAIRDWLELHTNFDWSPEQLAGMQEQVLRSARAMGRIAHILLELEPGRSQEIQVRHVKHAFKAVRKHCTAGLGPKLVKERGRACKG